MNKSTVAVAAAIVLGSFMALLNFLSTPSPSLLAANSTMVLVLTITSVVLLTVPRAKPVGKKTQQALGWTRRTPLNEMVGLLKGASNGYTWNRKEIALVLRSAVNAKIGNEVTPLPLERTDSYLRRVLGDERFDEFFSEDGWRAAKVEGSHGYLTRLRDVVASLTKSLEF